jgi:hypothetical protein
LYVFRRFQLLETVFSDSLRFFRFVVLKICCL